MDGNHVEKSVLNLIPFKFLKHLTLVENSIDVNNGGMATLIQVTFVFMKEFTVEKNPMDVSNVGKFSLKAVTFEFMKELTLERNYGCKQCGKDINQCTHLHVHRRAHTLCIYAM
jgi:hypothetical protein